MRIAASLLLALSCCIAPSRSQATVRNVPADFPSIQAALDASSSGDEVLVAPGNYVGALVLGSRHNGVRLASVGGPAITTIDGGHTGTTITCNGVGSAASIEGFTITGGGTLPLSYTVGGGMLLWGSALTVSGNIISGNTCGAAAGIYVDGGSPAILGNTLSGNSAPFGSGGGIYCDHGTRAIIRGNVIVDNSCAAYGGGVSVWENSTPDLSLNTIVGNHAALGGGGLYVVRYSQATVTGTILAFNTDNGVVAGDALSGCSFACSDVFGNTPGNFVSIADPTGSNGNQSADPLFCGLVARDLHLADASPCASTHAPASCGREGALDPQCSVTPTRSSSWGRLKANYR